MPEQLPDHTHCLVCDAAVPADQRFCSERCESEFEKASKKSKRRNNVYMVLVVAAAIGVGALSLFL
jgi:predicted nucleic acid-binding Zn ribbon protein